MIVIAATEAATDKVHFGLRDPRFTKSYKGWPQCENIPRDAQAVVVCMRTPEDLPVLKPLMDSLYNYHTVRVVLGPTLDDATMLNFV